MSKAEQTFRTIEDRTAEHLPPTLQSVTDAQRTRMATAFRSIVDSVIRKTDSLQREVSRQILPDIQDQLLEAYQDASEESGEGMFIRMKNIMNTHVSIHAINMFEYTKMQTDIRMNSLGDKVYVTMTGQLKDLERAVLRTYSGLWENLTATPDQILARSMVRKRAQELRSIAAQLLAIAKKANALVREENQAR